MMRDAKITEIYEGTSEVASVWSIAANYSKITRIQDMKMLFA